jgi:hypothetical protein
MGCAVRVCVFERLSVSIPLQHCGSGKAAEAECRIRQKVASLKHDAGVFPKVTGQ